MSGRSHPVLVALGRGLRAPTLRWALVLALATLLLSRVPGFDVLSFHMALALAPLLAMATGSLAVTSAREALQAGTGWGQATQTAAVRAMGVALVPLVGGLLSSLVSGPCDLVQGLAFFLVWPLASAVTILPVGLWCGWVGQGPRLGSALLIGIFLLSFLPAAVDLYREPPIFFHAPFLGRYPGAIYDVALEVTAADLAYRLVCLLAAGALWLTGAAWTSPRHRRLRASLAASLLGIALGLGSQGALWGFRVTRANLERVLAREESLDRCRLRHDGSLDSPKAQGLLRDCLYHLRRAEAFFDLPPGPPITLYWYRDDRQKARWLGARQVEIAKPWQDAVHLSGVFPLDPVIGHEIAHVVAGRLAPPPFRVPLRAGLVPDMARVEGLAEAVAFAGEGPSPHEWARAMVLSGLPVDLRDLFGPWSFLAAAPARAYTLAGSFLTFLADHFGTSALQAIARGRSFEEATGFPLAELQVQWRTFLEQVHPSVDRLLLDRAAGRFGGPGVLGHRCAVDVARLHLRAGDALEAGDLSRAEACLQQALRHSPDSPGLRRAIARLRLARGDADNLGKGPPPHRAGSPGERLWQTDRAAFLGAAPDDDRGALETWRDLALGLPPHAAEARSLAARAHALDLPPAARRAVLGLLMGLPGSDNTLAEVVPLAPDDGLVHWMAGRAALARGRFPEALDHLVLAGLVGLPGPLVVGDPDPFRAEYPKALGMAALGAGELDLARRALGAALPLQPYEGDRLFLEDLLARLSLWGLPSDDPAGGSLQDSSDSGSPCRRR